MASSNPALPPERRAILLDPRDNTAAAAMNLQAGDVAVIDGATITMRDPVPLGHKLAVRAIRAGEHVLKYGGSIGSATCDIAPGEHVHLHNLKSDYLPTYTFEHPDHGSH